MLAVKQATAEPVDWFKKVTGKMGRRQTHAAETVHGQRRQWMDVVRAMSLASSHAARACPAQGHTEVVVWRGVAVPPRRPTARNMRA